MYCPRNSSYATWFDLKNFVQQDRRYVGRLYKRFEQRPFTSESFEELKERGIEIKFVSTKDYLGQVEIFPNGSSIILMKEGIFGFERDVTIFHELMHVWYDPMLDDSPNLKNEQRCLSNEARTEWLARRARAQPELLRIVIEGFDLKPEVYDKASCLAFEYKFGKKNKYKFIFMD